MSTSGDIMSTLGVFSTSEGYHEYIGGCSVHRRDTISTSGGYLEYVGICSIHRGMFSTPGDFMIHVGDIMSTLGDVQYPGEIS